LITADNVKNSFIVVLPNQIITIPQDSNLAWLPLFYALPKELIIKRKDYLDIPRNPYDVIRTDKYDNLIMTMCFSSSSGIVMLGLYGSLFKCLAVTVTAIFPVSGQAIRAIFLCGVCVMQTEKADKDSHD